MAESTKIYAVANQKGGVGKSTTVQNLGAGLARAGKQVLLIDVDPQSNLTAITGATSDAEKTETVTMLEVLCEEKSINAGIQHLKQFDIIPASMFLASIDGRIPNQLARPYRLQKAISELQMDYDYILIDTPPALGTVTSNALIAAQEVIVPAQADVLSLQGVSQLFETIQAAREHANPTLKIAGILLTRFNARTRLSQELSNLFTAAAKQMDTRLFDTRIRESVVVKEAQAAYQDIFQYDAKSNPAIDYAALTKEIFDVEVPLHG